MSKSADCILHNVNNVVTIEDTTTKEKHLLDQVAESPSGTLWYYSHQGLRTPFSRWLAINRQRRNTRFRHTAKDISRVVFSITDVAEEDGIVAFDNGRSKNYLAYYQVDQGRVSLLAPNQVQNLKVTGYFLWKLDRVTNPA